MLQEERNMSSVSQRESVEAAPLETQQDGDRPKELSPVDAIEKLNRFDAVKKITETIKKVGVEEPRVDFFIGSLYMALSYKTSSEVPPEKWGKLCKKLARVIGRILGVSVSPQLVTPEEYPHLFHLLLNATHMPRYASRETYNSPRPRYSSYRNHRDVLREALDFIEDAAIGRRLPRQESTDLSAEVKNVSSSSRSRRSLRLQKRKGVKSDVLSPTPPPQYPDEGKQTRGEITTAQGYDSPLLPSLETERDLKKVTLPNYIVETPDFKKRRRIQGSYQSLQPSAD